MTDGQPPNIIGPLAGLAAIGVMAYGAKTVIDVLKEKSLEQKKKKPIQPLYREPRQQAPRVSAEADNRIDRGLNKMLGR